MKKFWNAAKCVRYVFMSEKRYTELEQKFCAMMNAWQLPLNDPAHCELDDTLREKYFNATHGQSIRRMIMNFFVSIKRNVKNFVYRLRMIHKYPQYVKMTEEEFEELKKKYNAMTTEFESHREEDGCVLYPYDYELGNAFTNAVLARHAKKNLWKFGA